MGTLESKLAMMKAANAANKDGTDLQQPNQQSDQQTNIKQPHSKFESDAFDRLGGVNLSTKSK